MRFLGFLFIIALIVGAVGYFRGWFTVVTTHASGKGEVTLGVDNDKIRDDAEAAAAGVGRLSRKAAETVRSLGRKVGSDATELEGTLTALDLTARDLTVTAHSETIELRVPATVPIIRDGTNVGFEQLRLSTRVKLSFAHDGEDRRLTRIEILP